MVVKQRDAANAEIAQLQKSLKVFEKLLAGRSTEQAERLLAAGENAEKRLREAREQVDECKRKLEEKDKALVEAERQKLALKTTLEEKEKTLAEADKMLTEAGTLITKHRKILDSLPPNVAELAK